MNQNEEQKVLDMIESEFKQGIEKVHEFNPSVTFYGSARLKEDHPYYQKVKNLAFRISKELSYTVMSGGGAGIMEASNRGAYEAGGKSVGLTIRLPREQHTNKYVTDEIPFNFFFARQSAMSYETEVCIFCPGGFGTLNELFEILTLQQTGKIGKIPLILFGKDFWKPFEKVIEEILLQKYETISENDLKLYKITDNEEEVLDIIKNSKIRDGDDALK
ncbi:TPA: TIGR00730 family Rossman fold protein [Candidatus Nomurabacteria bacterium]|nr:MAG: hypothetical protein O210_OD1C00001G0440 [Parcubacteria bacterium RAAC4_OD1_1]HCY26332.1 TIGR00730 family Rossman fold protein [Candidatus Nomurabacteria bacterium]